MPLRGSGGVWDGTLGGFEGSQGGLGGCWVCSQARGEVLGRSWGRLGDVLGGLGTSLGPSWVIFGPSWSQLGATMGMIRVRG